MTGRRQQRPWVCVSTRGSAFALGLFRCESYFQLCFDYTPKDNPNDDRLSPVLPEAEL